MRVMGQNLFDNSGRIIQNGVVLEQGRLALIGSEAFLNTSSEIPIKPW